MVETASAPGSGAPRRGKADHRCLANRAVGLSTMGFAATGLLELARLRARSRSSATPCTTSPTSRRRPSVYAGFWLSARPATARYPYGYERGEDLAGLGVVLVIWASAVLAGVESYLKLVGHGPTSAVYAGMASARLGMVGNQLVARYKLRVGTAIHSTTLVADARHSRLDALSSAGAAGGLAVVAAGYWWGDPLAGFAVTLFIVHVGVTVTRDLLHHLMDGVDAAHLDAAAAAETGVPGVHGVTLRGRWTGRSLRIEIDGDVDPAMSVGDADRIGEAVEAAVLAAVEEARVVRWSPRAAVDARVAPTPRSGEAD